MSSEEKSEADDLSRPEADQHVRLEHLKFAEICAWARRDFDMYLMATPVSAQRLPGKTGVLPLYSKFHAVGCQDVDVLCQDLSTLGDSGNPCFGYCCSPTKIIGVVLQRLAECRAQAVVIVPDVRRLWYHLFVYDRHLGRFGLLYSS